MDWNSFKKAFSSSGSFWHETQLYKNKSSIMLLNTTDGTTEDDLKFSQVMTLCLKNRFGTDIPILSEEEDNLDWNGTGFVLDPIDGSWNYYFDYPAHCRIVSYLKNGSCQYFSIFSNVDNKSICSDGVQILLEGRPVEYSSLNNPLVSVMYNMHYSLDKKRELLDITKQLITSELNVRISGSPGFDLYSLLSGQVGGVINVSPHQFDAGPIIDCLSRSGVFVTHKLINESGSGSIFIGRHTVAKKLGII